MDPSPTTLELLWTKLLDPALYRDNAAPVIGALFGLFAAWVAAGWVSRLVYRSLKLAKIDETLARFATKFTWWGLLVLALACCLESFGVKTTSYVPRSEPLASRLAWRSRERWGTSRQGSCCWCFGRTKSVM